MKKFLAIATCAVIALAASAAQPTALDFFSSAPDKVASGLPQYCRLDMADYFTYGSKAKVENKLGEKYSIRSLSPQMLVYAGEDSITTAVCVLPAVASDTVLMVIRTIPLPVTDSEITFYDKSWKPLKSDVFKQPKLSDWIAVKDKHRQKELERELPFVISSAIYDPDSKCLILTNLSPSYFYEKEIPASLGIMEKELKYVWNGKKFIADGRR